MAIGAEYKKSLQKELRDLLTALYEIETSADAVHAYLHGHHVNELTTDISKASLNGHVKELFEVARRIRSLSTQVEGRIIR